MSCGFLNGAVISGETENVMAHEADVDVQAQIIWYPQKICQLHGGRTYELCPKVTYKDRIQMYIGSESKHRRWMDIHFRSVVRQKALRPNWLSAMLKIIVVSENFV